MVKLLVTKELAVTEILQLSESFPDIHCDSVPFISIKLLRPDYPSLYPYKVFTSQNAVKSISTNITVMNEVVHSRCIAVGNKTAEALDHIGCRDVLVPSLQSSKGVIELLKSYPKINGISYFCGKQRMPYIEAFLKDHDYSFNLVEVYETIDVKVDLDIQQYDALVFASPSAVQSFFAQYDVSHPCFAIGPSTANELKHYTREVLVSSTPSLYELFHTVSDFYRENEI
ncbi:uroporphyrinogen-III synthase [Halosquirtibacter xylanolyticus]|uniref:uroporphyrinogen-III synthase n=1 Tax=Halosquirtibacter xylanolyticus TaxID=3374599 RepID=UPI003749AD5D|nr:uroporphyrinogen-III synthase [Prolixibacteraceae bacterium]